MDLDTLLVTVYVLVDDYYKQHLAPLRPARGRPPRMSDSEILTLALIGQWQVGVPWRSERGLVRYIHAHYAAWFPTMLERSAFNQRVRQVWGMLLRLQQVLGEALQTPDDVYEAVDSLPLAAGTLAQYSHVRGHWLWTSTVGWCRDGWFWGDHLFSSVTPSGVMTGWLLGAAHIQDRWLLEALLSARAGQPALIGPPPRARESYARRAQPPVGSIGPFAAVGATRPRPYLGDENFNGARWQIHWQQRYQAEVLAAPPANARSQRPWTRREQRSHASHRQIVDTVFARLTDVFGIKRLAAHSRWGQYTRVAAKVAAYHLGLYLNRQLGRPDGALGTLIC